MTIEGFCVYAVFPNTMDRDNAVVPPSNMLRRLRALFFRLDLSPLSPLGIGRSRF